MSKSNTRECLSSLLIISHLFGLFPTHFKCHRVSFLLNLIIPLTQFTLVATSFYWTQYEIANFRATNISSTLISVTILEFILAGFTLVFAVTKSDYIDQVSRCLDQVNLQLAHLQDKQTCEFPCEQRLCLLKWINMMGVFFFCYLADALVVYFILDIPFLSLLSVYYMVHLRILLQTLPLFTFLFLIRSRYTCLNIKLATSLSIKSRHIFQVLPQSSFISHRQYKRIALIHNSLSECCAILNETFSALLCLLLTHHVVVGVLSLYWTSVHAILYYEGGEEGNIYIYAGQVMLLNIKICAHTWYLLSQCNATQVLSEDTVVLVNKLFIRDALSKVNQEPRHVRDQLKRHKISFSPYGLFELDLHFFYTFVTIIITYWVILIQFQV